MLRTLAALACVFVASLISLGEEPAADLALVRGVVLDESGQPAAGVIVTAASQPFERPSTKTDAQGRFSLQVDRKRSNYLKLLASADNGRQKALFARDELKPQPLDAVEIKLGKTREIQVRVVDEQDQPIAGARAVAVASYSKLAEQPTDAEGKATLLVPAGVDLQYVYAVKPKVGLDYFHFHDPRFERTDPYELQQDHAKPVTLTLSGVQPVTVRVVDEKDRPLAGVRVGPARMELPKRGGWLNTNLGFSVTNENGTASFDAIPSGVVKKFEFWASKDRYSSPQRWVFDPAGATEEITARLLPQVLLTGVVTRDGKPAAGATVKIVGDGYTFDSFHSDAVCDRDGKFEIYVDDDKAYALMAEGERECSGVELRVVTAGRKLKPVELALEPATRVFGVLRGVADQKPLAGEYLLLQGDEDLYYKLPKDEWLPDKGSTKGLALRHTRNAQTDAQGRFEFYAGRGENYYLWNSNVEAAKFTLEGQPQLELNLQTKRPPKTKLQITVVQAGDVKRPVADAQVLGMGLEESTGMFGGTTDSAGKVAPQRDAMAARVFAKSDDGLLCALVDVDANSTELVVPLQPAATAKGKLLDEKTGLPMADQELQYGVKFTFMHRNGAGDEIRTYTYLFGGNATTDATGQFVISGLATGAEYDVQAVIRREPDGMPRSWRRVATIKADKAVLTDLGELKLAEFKEYRPPTRDELIERAMTPPPVHLKGRLTTPTVEERVALKVHDAKLLEQQVLVLITPKASPICRHFFELYYGTEAGAAEKLSAKTINYALLAIDATEGKPLDSARKTLESLKIPLPEEDSGTFAILDQEGKLVAAAAAGDLLDKDEHLDVDKLLEFVNKHARALPDAEKLLSDALAQAKRDDKRVLVQVSGAFCAPCVLLSRYLDEQKELIAKDYVIVKLDDRFIGGPETIKRVRTEAGGIPWTVILDADGKQLITSTAKSGNIGFPSEPEGIEHFEKMLSSTAQRLTKEEIGKLVETLGSRDNK